MKLRIFKKLIPVSVLALTYSAMVTCVGKEFAIELHESQSEGILLIKRNGAEPEGPEYTPNYLTFTAVEDDCDVYFYYHSKESLSYSTKSNGSSEWSPWINDDVDGPLVSLDYAGDQVRFKGKNVTFNDDSSNDHIDVSGNVAVSGSVTSITDENGGNPNVVLTEKCYYSMFDSCSCISDISELVLPAMTLAEKCYEYMFYHCDNITEIPEGLLPATSLAKNCYESMFERCESLTTVPENLLPATDLAEECYDSMFNECEMLNTLPNLPATELAKYCYSNMFSGCCLLEEIPSDYLPATTLADGCYDNMFEDCTSLESLPSGLLPATSLAEECYEGMFEDCTGLITIPTDLLPATEMVTACYGGMFSGCESLTVIPFIPATTLANECFSYMFSSCDSIEMLGTSDATHEIEWSIQANEYEGLENWNQYMFGWCTNVNLDGEGSTEVNVKTTYYLLGTLPGHSVTYNSNTTDTVSGTLPTDSNSYKSGAQVTVSTSTLSREGYDFVGWNTNPEATTGLSTVEMGSSDLVLYAIWSAHEHSYSNEWSHDDNQHWHASTCGHSDAKSDVANHTWNEGVVTTQPTESAKGVKTFTCTVCGTTKTEDVAMLTHQKGTHHNAVAATCETAGTVEYWDCANCSEKLDANGNVLSSIVAPATGHNVVKHEQEDGKVGTSGHKAYYECSVCHKCFTDEEAETPIVNINTWKQKGGDGYVPENNTPVIVPSAFVLALIILYLVGYVCLYRQGRLDEKKLGVIYKWLPRGKKNLN